MLTYLNKISESEIVEKTAAASLFGQLGGLENKLIFGENLAVLKALLESQSRSLKVDLVYIDPPFATQNSFTIGSDRVSTISNSRSDRIAYTDELGGSEFLEFLRQRLILIRELMAETASIYVHIDYKIGHYVKVIMDEIFGARNFRNDITRIKCNPKNFQRKAYGNIKDLILFYTKSDAYTWNEARDKFSEDDIGRLFKKTDENGRRYTTIPLHAPGETVNGATSREWRGLKPPRGRHWRSEPNRLDGLEKAGLIEWSAKGVPRKKIYADEQNGKKKQDIWEYKDPQYPIYPTEKNAELVQSIISTSSSEGNLVLDCFAGSGTTLLAADRLGRRWLGVDQSREAIRVIRQRFLEAPRDLFSTHPVFEFLTTDPTCTFD